jgi:hypothetical protein
MGDRGTHRQGFEADSANSAEVRREESKTFALRRCLSCRRFYRVNRKASCRCGAPRYCRT